MSGHVEVTYTSLKSVYSIMDTYIDTDIAGYHSHRLEYRRRRHPHVPIIMTLSAESRIRL